MAWLVLTYMLPSNSRSSPRVTLWRRLRRLGALQLAGGVYILPVRDECTEAFQWLAQEIRQAEGEALLMHIERFDGLTDAQVVARFCEARGKDYAELATQATALEQALADHPDNNGTHQESLDRLRRRYADIARVDYFGCAAGARIDTRLTRIAQALAGAPTPAAIALVARTAYEGRRWVTRPRPHVDRLACAWLIRHFIDPAAPIRYATTPEPDEIAFDMADALFGHHGSHCSFETMLEAFGLDDPGLRTLAEIVHEIDLRDGRYVHPEIPGVDTILRGWLLAGYTDSALESHGIALFDGLYTARAGDRG